VKSRLPFFRLLGGLIRGTGSEFLRGDLIEDYRARVACGQSRIGAEAAYLIDVLGSVARWWSPAATRQRRRNELDGSYDPQRTWRGRGGGHMGDWVTELRQGARGLVRRPGFTLLAVLTLALGIGATTTIISVVDSVVLRPLPYENPDELMSVGLTFPDREWNPDVGGLQNLEAVSYLNFLELKDRTRAFAQLGGMQRLTGLLPDAGLGPEIVGMGAVTEGFLEMVGAPLVLGRTFSPDEYDGSASVVLLSQQAWITRYGSDPNVIGLDIAQNSVVSNTVVGVLAKDFTPPEALMGGGLGGDGIEFWIPLNVDHGRYRARQQGHLNVIGRLAPGSTIESARAELQRFGSEIAREFPAASVLADGTHRGYGTNTLLAETVGTSGRALIMFLGAAALLLAIAALNAANLLLVRGLDRSSEMSIRLALGAGRGSLVRGVLTESLLISALGGVLGVALSYLGVELFLKLSPDLPRLAEVGVDGRILAITAAVSIGAGLLTGLAPIAGLGRIDPAHGMKEDAGRGTYTGGRLRSALVTFQLGLALVLAVGASLLLHSFVRLRTVDPGFEPEGLTAFTMPVKRPGGPDQVWQSWDELLAAVRQTPGLIDVGATSNLPFEASSWAPAVLLPDDPEEDQRTGISGYVISRNYLRTAGIDIVQGRPFESTDGPDGQRVALVNEAFLRAHFPVGDPIGMEIRLPEETEAGPRRVVGVVEDVVQVRPEDGWRPAIYVPYTQAQSSIVKVAVRSSTETETPFAQLREAGARFTTAIPILDMARLPSRIRAVRTGPRFQVALLTAFAAVALLLAAIGLYGSLAHSVGRRTRELGVRVALGAGPGTIYALVLRNGMAIAATGLGIGLVGSVALSRLIERYLFEVAPLDPTAFLVASVGLVVATLLAVLRPAHRAARVNVVDCLKAE
jgi:putative ABC transport system permease protein